MSRRKSSTPVRLWWYTVYRQLRIVRRESAKATLDAMLYGVGYVEIDKGLPDLIRYIPLTELAA